MYPYQSDWVYPYQSDPRGGEHALRPVALVRVNDDVAEQYALADSGSDHTILSPRLADELDLDYDTDNPLRLAFAGPGQPVYPTPVTLRLLPPADVEDEPVTWQADVVVASQWVAWFDVLLGQRGFFDRFTATFSRCRGLRGRAARRVRPAVRDACRRPGRRTAGSASRSVADTAQ